MQRIMSALRALGLPGRSSAPRPIKIIDILPNGNDTIYAVGDIHGELKLLRKLLAIIAQDTESSGGRVMVIFLGDYIDRGPDSAGVLDLLISRYRKEWEVLHLCGNHEEMFLNFLEGPRRGHEWLSHGGVDTLTSYGARDDERRTSSAVLSSLASSHIPDDHLAFLRSLPHMVRYGQYAFVHAGIRPGIPLDQQDSRDLLWIRQGFLDQSLDPDLTIVHGHTPGREPVVAPGRICVDTGAYAYGQLTAVRLRAGAEPVFLSARTGK